MDMDHGKILIIELMRDIPESNLWYQFSRVIVFTNRNKYRSIGSGVSPVKFFNVQVYAIFRNLGSTGHIDFISIN